MKLRLMLAMVLMAACTDSGRDCIGPENLGRTM